MARWVWLILACLSVLPLGLAVAQAEPLPCFLEVPVYDARGDRLEFRIVSVTVDGEEPVNLLTVKDKAFRMTSNGERLYFPKRALRTRIEITLEDKQGARIKQTVPLMGCQQRASFRHGERDSGADVSWSSVTGRFSGCKFDGDWWLRAMPMFGVQNVLGSYEGYIRPGDGTFALDTSMNGERLILIVGKGKEPVRTLTVDVIVGGKNDVGTVDLTGACPK